MGMALHCVIVVQSACDFCSKREEVFKGPLIQSTEMQEGVVSRYL